MEYVVPRCSASIPANNHLEGLSHDKRLISPIRPGPYGDRFKAFIEGITGTPEEFATSQANNEQSLSIDGVADAQKRTSLNPGEVPNSTVARNELEAIKSEEELREQGKEPDGASEDRIFTTLTSHNGHVTTASESVTSGNAILPVVEEVGEHSAHQHSNGVADDGELPEEPSRRPPKR